MCIISLAGAQLVTWVLPVVAPEDVALGEESGTSILNKSSCQYFESINEAISNLFIMGARTHVGQFATSACIILGSSWLGGQSPVSKCCCFKDLPFRGTLCL